ncbi:MAG: hypothetical protein NUW37_03550 [Planctomycetes bacterium]|nr:hypothetical protein [Planctomycetota bacterium]
MNSDAPKSRRFLKLIFSAAVFLLGVECALQLGHLVFGEEYVAEDRDPSKTAILCVGDSFTWGLGAPSGESYPDRLRALVEEHRPGKFQVIQKGRLGDNTSQMYYKLAGGPDDPGFLGWYSPAVVIFFGGLNNRWKVDHSAYFEIKNGAEIPESSWWQNFEMWSAENVRTYRLAKIVAMEPPEGPPASVWEDRASDLDKWIPEDDGIRGRVLAAREKKLAGDAKGALADFEEIRGECAASGRLDPELVGLIGRLRQELGDADALSDLISASDALQDERFDELRRAIVNAYVINGDREKAAEVMIWTLDRRTKINRTVYGFISDIIATPDERGWLEKFPKLMESFERTRDRAKLDEPEMYNLLFIAGEDLSDGFDWAKRILRYDLERLLLLQVRFGFKLVVVDYPLGYFAEELCDFAENHPDTISILTAESFRDANPEKVFTADGHCTGEGYRVIARRIFDEMKKRGFLA